MRGVSISKSPARFPPDHDNRQPTALPPRAGLNLHIFRHSPAIILYASIRNRRTWDRLYLNERQRNAGSPREIAEELWAERLRMYLDALRKTPADVAGSRKGAEWKVAVATAMKRHSTASNPWLAKQLNMGSPFRLSRLAAECRRTPARFSPYVDRIAKCKV